MVHERDARATRQCAGGDESAPEVRVPADSVRQKRDSVRMGVSQERVRGGLRRQKCDSAWIFAGAPALGDGESIHYRRFGARRAASPAPGRVERHISHARSTRKPPLPCGPLLRGLPALGLRVLGLIHHAHVDLMFEEPEALVGDALERQEQRLV